MTSKSTNKGAFFYIVVGLSTLLVVLTLLSLIYGLPYWYLKILDFPRLQFFIVLIVLLILFIAVTKKWKGAALALGAGLLSSILIQFTYLIPYWFGATVVPDSENQFTRADNQLSILIVNVLMTNKKSQPLVKLIEEKDPDIVLAMEVNDQWIKDLSAIESRYAETLKAPFDNAYGMSMYSKIPVSNSKINYLNHSEVPSFFVDLTLRSGQKVKFYGVHPVAPFPSDKYPENIGDDLRKNDREEVALKKVGNSVNNDQVPAIVAGDFNDVAWARTARMFDEEDELYDTRIGRGLLNTFDATSFFMRWPLDHFYVTEGFSVIKLEKLRDIESDHFPLYIELEVPRQE